MATFGQFTEFGPYFSSSGALYLLKVYHYLAGTTTLQNMWVERSKSTTVAQPLASDSAGIASAFGDGLYKFRIDGSTDGVNYSTIYTVDNVAVVDQSETLSGEGAAIASAATLTLGTDGNIFHITGSTGPITAISGNQATVILIFDSTPTITNSGNLILQYGEDYTVAANTVMEFFNEGSGVWRETLRNPSRDTGFRVVGSADATKKIAFEADGITTATTRTLNVADEDMSLGQSWEVKNLTMTATVGSSALTIALKTKGGSDASSTNPILFKFRNATAGTGDYATVALTAASSIVVSSGSTLGTASGIAHRLYVGICNDGGTLRPFIYNPLVSATFSLSGLQDDLLYSSTAEGGAGGADSAQVLYSGTAFTTKAIRILGYVESTQATAGTWATTPSKIHLLKPWDKRTGDTVQVQWNTTGAVATGTTVTPTDDTIPQITEGTEFMTQAITPTSAVNMLTILHIGNYSFNAAANFVVHLHQDATADALAAFLDRADAASASFIGTLRYQMRAGTVSSTTFRIRVGESGAGTVTFNGFAGARKLGGVMASFLEVREVMV